MNETKISSSEQPPLDLGKFQKDPLYFLRTFFITLIVFVVADYLLLVSNWGQPFKFSISTYHFLLILPALYFGGISVIIIHNASHSCLRPRWLNRIYGEIAGTHQLYGFIGWKTAHILHHHYPDDPDKDPHPPLNRTYREYSVKMIFLLMRKLTVNYYTIWGAERKYKLIWSLNSVCGFLGLFARLLFWYVLLTPAGFLFFYIPSYLFNYFVGSHLNYYTHIPDKKKEGMYKILNLNHNLYFKLANAIFFGIYYHKNHHIKPNLINPSLMEEGT